MVRGEYRLRVFADTYVKLYKMYLILLNIQVVLNEDFHKILENFWKYSILFLGVRSASLHLKNAVILGSVV